MAQPMSPIGQGLGKPQSQGARIFAPRLHTPHGQKAMQGIEMIPDRLSMETPGKINRRGLERIKR
jgi:hypothetical protein